jgi:hypothetical protein
MRTPQVAALCLLVVAGVGMDSAAALLPTRVRLTTSAPPPSLSRLAARPARAPSSSALPSSAASRLSRRLAQMARGGGRRAARAVRPSSPLSIIESDGYGNMPSQGRVRSLIRALQQRLPERFRAQPGTLILVRHGESEWNLNKV